MDDEDDFEPGIDGCSHGVGFDETCEWCDLEIFEEAQAARRQARSKKQPDLFEPQPGMCPAPIGGKLTARECIEAGQCGCNERDAHQP